jgi:hypothetical protein
MKNLTKFILFTGALFSVVTVKAQKTDTVKTNGWFKQGIAGAAQLQLTYRKASIGQLNGALNANGIPSIKPNNLWINASMSHIWDNWIMENGIGFTPIASAEANGIRARYNQYQVYGRVGYNVAQSPDFRLYPFVGVNFSAAVLNIRDRNAIDNTNSFSDELLNKTSSKTFYQPNFGIELGGGFDYLIKVKPKKMDCYTIERSIPIGVRAGYYINAYAGDWNVDSHTLHDSPNQKQGAVFVSFNIGLGYKISKQ